MASGAGSPCGACKFLRRKCLPECVFAPYFGAEEGPVPFAAIHRVFGASNVSKLLRRVSPPERCAAVGPVYGCVAHVFALQQEIASLEAQVMQGRAQLGLAMADLRPPENPSRKEASVLPRSCSGEHSASPQSSLDCTHLNDTRDPLFMEEQRPRKRAHHGDDLGELHDLALRMMMD
ncbi:unnamed protein product [Spirodela intermedia]|uniref:LOB domain-containing protein n=1 Tax=Spirodela intermedia TaxID=51605 RepID=A0A7I8IY29_SPIIN|nr:unnamed protein product [Spirodela intermedia]CAA6662612.1 unnamed protein product [Spirodela intermedia]